MTEQSEIFRAMREHQMEKHSNQRHAAAKEIARLIRQGFSVRMFTPYQFRFNGRLDIFPTRQRFHDLEANRRGSYRELEKFVVDFFAKGRELPAVDRNEFIASLVSIGWSKQEAAHAFDHGVPE